MFCIFGKCIKSNCSTSFTANFNTLKVSRCKLHKGYSFLSMIRYIM